MSFLFEDPLMVIVSGAIVAAVLAVVFVQTGRAAWLLGAGGVVLLVLLAVFVERMVVTRREQVESTLDEIAAKLEANDKPGVLALIASDASMRHEAESRMAQVQVSEVRFSGLKIVIEDAPDPQRAEARFFVRASVKDSRQQLPYDDFFRRVKVQLKRRGERWYIQNYELEDLVPGKQ